jgi:mono/diheme cytochrome c family protein
LTEIPEHLLERSRARRAALGLGGDEGAAPAKAEAAGAAPAAAATPASAAPAARGKAAPVELAKPPAIVLSPYAQAAVARKKIPFWAVPVLLFLPLWGFLYWGTLDKFTPKASGPLAAGEAIYTGKGCQGCHGATGGGAGSIPGLTTTHETFPDFAEQVWWVVNGSAASPPGVAKGTPYGSPDRPGGQRVAVGGMPAWGNALSAKELLDVVYFERVQFGGEDPAKLARLEALAESAKLPASFKEGATVDEIKAILDGVVPPTAANAEN